MRERWLGFLKTYDLKWIDLALASVIIAVGIIFRLIWPLDIEFKNDEIWSFNAMMRTHSWADIPLIGMASSVGIKVSGLSAWMFILLGKVYGATRPEELARAVQYWNIVGTSLVLLIPFYLREKKEAKFWWAAMLVAWVNPFAVLFQRKIWPQCLFPLFSVLFLLFFLQRGKRTGALLWGLIGVLMFQLQMSPLFLAAGFFLWIVLFDRNSTRWKFYFLGVGIGVLPALPWLKYLLLDGGIRGLDSYQINLKQILSFPFYRTWATDPLGTRLMYAIGDYYTEFEKLPMFFGHFTYGVKAVSILLHLGVVVLVLKKVVLFFKEHQYRNLKQFLSGSGSETRFILNAALFGAGLLITLKRLMVHRHYLITFFPLTYLWLVYLIFTSFKKQRVWFALFLCSQIFLSWQFLSYLHENCGAPKADYGLMYRCQPPHQ